MVEHYQAVEESHVAVGQLQIVEGFARQPRFEEIFELITPVAETPTQRKRQVEIVDNLTSRD